MRLEVVTPRGTLLSTDADEVTAPGILGEFGVLPGHIPFFTGIRPGSLRYRGGGHEGAIVVGPGFAEISNDRIVVLCDIGAKVQDVDSAAAQAELAKIQKQLDEWHSDDAGARAHLEAQLEWARARVEAAAAVALTPRH